MNILLTGANGFIGQHLFKMLKSYNYNVIGISKTGNNCIKCDITKYKKLEKVISQNNIDMIIHLAAFISSDKKYKIKIYNVNVKGTENLLKAGKKAKIKGFIYISSMSIYGKQIHTPVTEEHNKQPSDYYGKSKLEGEEICQKYKGKFNIIILRFAGVFGHGKNQGAVYNFVVNALKSKDLYVHNDGSQTHDFVYINDAVRSVILALRKIKKIKFDIFNIGSGMGISVKELANLIIKICNSNSRLLFDKNNKNKQKFLLDIHKAKKILNYKPTPFAINLKYFINGIK